MKYKKEINTCRYLIKRLKLGYGANCRTSDLDDFSKIYRNPKNKLSEAIMLDRRCGSCRAGEVIVWLKEHIKLLKD